MADGKFEEIIREQCKKDIEEQVIKLADNRGIGIKDVDISLGEQDGSIQVNSVDINIDKQNKTDYKDINGPDINTTNNNIQDIEDIEIADITGSMEAVDAMSDEGNRRKASGKNVRKLKEDISTYFIIKEAAVNIWE